MFQIEAQVKGQVDVDTSSDFTITLVAGGLSIVGNVLGMLILDGAVFVNVDELGVALSRGKCCGVRTIGGGFGR